LASVAACDKTSALLPKPNNPVDCGQMNWSHLSLAISQGNLTC